MARLHTPGNAKCTVGRPFRIPKHRMSRRVVIIQSNYVPWKGYFDLLEKADVVVLFDSVQSTKNDWRNRNLIKTPTGKLWLTVPIKHSSTLRVRDVEVAASNWHGKHFRTLSQAYARAPHASGMLARIGEWYEQAGKCTRLSDINRIFLGEISRMLDVRASFVEVESVMGDAEHDRLDPTARLVEICRRLGADSYLSGPAARGYLDEELFQAASIPVEWFDYDHYPAYPQLHGPFDHAVSILDLLLMVGPSARDFAIRDNPEFSQGAGYK